MRSQFPLEGDFSCSLLQPADRAGWKGEGVKATTQHVPGSCEQAQEQLQFRVEPEIPVPTGTHHRQEMLTRNSSAEPSDTCLSAEYRCD